MEERFSISITVARASQYSWGIHRTSYQSNGILNLPFQILGSKIPVNILPPYWPRKEGLLLRSVQDNQIEIRTLVEKSKLSKFQTVQYLPEQKLWPFNVWTSTTKNFNGITGKIWEKAGVKLLRDLIEKSASFSTLATSNIRYFAIFFVKRIKKRN